MLLLPLDDLLAAAREFLDPDVSRSGLDRCLRRHGVSNLNALRPRTAAVPHKSFKAYEPGFVHVDVKYLPQMADETTRPSRRLQAITCRAMDNGKEFTDRLFASRARAPTGEHEFDLLCTEFGIEPRLTPPKSPQTNGMVERFNGRSSDVPRTNRFDSALDLEQTLMRHVVRRSLGPMAFTAHTHTTSNFRSPPWGAERPCRR